MIQKKEKTTEKEKSSKETVIIPLRPEDIDAMDSRELSVEISKLWRKYQSTQSDLVDAKKSERASWVEKGTLEVELEGAKSEVDTLNVSMERLEKNYSKITEDYNELKIMFDGAIRAKGQAEAGFSFLIDALEQSYKMLASRYTDPMYRKIMEEIAEIRDSEISSVNSVLANIRGTPPVSPPIESPKKEAKP